MNPIYLILSINNHQCMANMVLIILPSTTISTNLCYLNNATNPRRYTVSPLNILVCILKDKDSFINYKLNTIINPKNLNVINIKYPVTFHNYLMAIYIYIFFKLVSFNWCPIMIYTLGFFIMSPKLFLIYSFPPITFFH